MILEQIIKGETGMLLSEAKRKIREAGYRIVKEEIEPEELGNVNKAMFFRQPKRLNRAFTGIDMIDSSEEEMNEEEFYSIVGAKVKGMCELYQIDIDEDMLKAMCYKAFDQGLSVKEAFKQLWIAIKKK